MKCIRCIAVVLWMVCARLPDVVLAQNGSTGASAGGSMSAAEHARTAIPSAAANEITNSIGMKLELIPAGEFMMGGGEKAEDLVKAFPQYGIAADFLADEFPQHRVQITKPFYFSKYETTNGRFKQFVDATGYKTQSECEETGKRGSGGWGFN